MNSIVNLGLIQMSCNENVQENYYRTRENIKEAARLGAQVICTQELFKSRYFCLTADSAFFNLAEVVDESATTVRELGKLAADLGVVIIASLFERRAAGLYHNTTVVLDADGRYLGKYRKMHIPEDPFFYEKFYFAPGDLGYKVFKTKYADIGVLICWDQWFPEAARLTAMKGAQIIFYPTAIGYMPGDREAQAGTRDAWEVVQRGHAVANGCFIAAVNRVGYEASPDGQGGVEFWGGSFVCDPLGQVLKRAAETSEEVVVCPLDLAAVEETRNLLAHFFRDRRYDSFQGLSSCFLDEVG